MSRAQSGGSSSKAAPSSSSQSLETSFISGTWHSGAMSSGGPNNNTKKQSAQQQRQAASPGGAGKQQQQQLSMAQRRHQNDLAHFRASKNRHQQKIDFPLFQPVQGEDEDDDNDDDDNNNNDNKSSKRRSGGGVPSLYTVEAAGNRPLVGEWVAQRHFLLFPRVPAVRDPMWLWALLKSYVLRRDCMAEAKKPPRRTRDRRAVPGSPTAAARQQQAKEAEQREQQQQQQTPHASSRFQRVALAASSSSKRTPSAGAATTPTPKRSTSRGKKKQSTSIGGRSATAVLPTAAAGSGGGGGASSSSPSWAGSPSRNLLHNSALLSSVRRQLQQKRLHGADAGDDAYHHEDGDDADEEGEEYDPEQERLAVLLNEKTNPETNPHVAKLQKSLMTVERRKQWYEQFDRTRRAERDALSDRRARAAAAKNLVREWTWEEDDAINARRQEQEQRDARDKEIAQERLLQRALRASDSLGIGGPIVVADFSYLKLRYLFELLEARPRNYKFAENSKNTQVAHKRSKLQRMLDEQHEKMNSTMATTVSGDDRNGDQSKINNHNGSPQRKTQSDSVVAAQSTEATFSNLLKLYRKHLLGRGASQTLLEFWKEEDAGIGGGAAAPPPPTGGGGGGGPMAHQQQQHFPLFADKVSQRFYIRFLAADFTSADLEGVPPNLQSAAYSFDTKPPPVIPTIHGLKLNGNRLVSDHVVQCPDGNWRSPPGPVSSFHDLGFVFDQRFCSNWRDTLVSVDLSENLLERVPEELLELPQLHTLMLQGNRIDNLNDPALKGLSVRGDPKAAELAAAEELKNSKQRNRRNNANPYFTPSPHQQHPEHDKQQQPANGVVPAESSQPLLRLSLYDNPVLDHLGLREYTTRLRNMFPLLSHLDNSYLPCVHE